MSVNILFFILNVTEESSFIFTSIFGVGLVSCLGLPLSCFSLVLTITTTILFTLVVVLVSLPTLGTAATFALVVVRVEVLVFSVLVSKVSEDDFRIVPCVYVPKVNCQHSAPTISFKPCRDNVITLIESNKRLDYIKYTQGGRKVAPYIQIH